MKASIMKATVAGLALAAVVPMTASAAMSGNIGYTSNYLWRGQTQSDNQAAVSGGLDMSAFGFYAGLWTSNMVTGTELDTYAGYSGKLGGFTYDIGYIKYAYPQTLGAADFSEVHVGGGYGIVTMTYSDDAENKRSYIDISANFSLSDKVSMGMHYGTGSKEVYGNDYNATLTSGNFTFGLSSRAGISTSTEADKALIPFVSYSQSFDF